MTHAHKKTEGAGRAVINLGSISDADRPSRDGGTKGPASRREDETKGEILCCRAEDIGRRRDEER